MPFRFFGKFVGVLSEISATASRNRRPMRGRRRKDLFRRNQPLNGPIKGAAYVIDGDTLEIHGHLIRLAGIDAPELQEPWGPQAKTTLKALCRGKIVTAQLTEKTSYGRPVAICTLSDGTDLSEQMVRKGMALDWWVFSQGKYRRYEPQGSRKKLWRVAKRQKPKK